MQVRLVKLVVVACGLVIAHNPPLGQAQTNGIPTKIMVRAISRDAKVISSKVGGARITIRNTATGDTLAQGIQQGSSGDTKLIMKQPRSRGATVYATPGTAGYLATVKLARPTVVEVIAEGPLDPPQATQRASKTLLLVPGQHILGEGVLLEIHGFRVELLSPEKESRFAIGSTIEVRAKITMA